MEENLESYLVHQGFMTHIVWYNKLKFIQRLQLSKNKQYGADIYMIKFWKSIKSV